MDTIQETVEELNNITDCDFFDFKSVHLAKVVKCYDGDTIHCIFKMDNKYQKFKVRLYGYDSPEMKPSLSMEPTLRADVIKKANAAKKQIEDFVLNKNVYLFCLGSDKYGRVLANIKLNPDDDKFINDHMISLGFGYEYFGGTKN